MSSYFFFLYSIRSPIKWLLWYSSTVIQAKDKEVLFECWWFFYAFMYADSYTLLHLQLDCIEKMQLTLHSASLSLIVLCGSSLPFAVPSDHYILHDSTPWPLFDRCEEATLLFSLTPQNGITLLALLNDASDGLLWIQIVLSSAKLALYFTLENATFPSKLLTHITRPNRQNLLRKETSH